VLDVRRSLGGLNFLFILAVDSAIDSKHDGLSGGVKTFFMRGPLALAVASKSTPTNILPTSAPEARERL